MKFSKKSIDILTENLCFTDYTIVTEEISNLELEIERLNNIIKEVREYITSYESISTIQGLEEIEANKDLDEKTLNEMIRRYMIVHDKILEILDKEKNNEN